jgi:hypothetical protein
VFNLQRFLRLAKAHWAEYQKTYAWFFGIGIMIHFVILILMFTAEGARAALSETQQGLYYMGLFLSAPIFAARYFQAMTRPESALIVLMRPASVFEKWLLAFLITAVLYPIVYTAAFYVCNLPASLLALPIIQSLSTGVEKDWLFFVLTDSKPSRWLTLLLSINTCQGFALLGALYFRKMPFIKTIVIAFIVLLITIFVGIVFHATPEMLFDHWVRDMSPSPAQQIVFPMVWVLMPALLWLASYFALKEREANS